MKISDFLSPANVMLDVCARDKAQLLRQLCSHAAAELGLRPEVVTAQIVKREELGSTGVGDGVALPHARIAEIKSPFGLVARLQRGIDFDAIDSQPVDIVFLLLLPESAHGEQLNALARVARSLRNTETRRRIREAVESIGAFQAIQ